MFAVAVVVVLLSVGLVSSSVYAKHGVDDDVLNDYCSGHFLHSFTTHYSECDLSGANLQDHRLIIQYMTKWAADATETLSIRYSLL